MVSEVVRPGEKEAGERRSRMRKVLKKKKKRAVVVEDAPQPIFFVFCDIIWAL